MRYLLGLSLILNCVFSWILFHDHTHMSFGLSLLLTVMTVLYNGITITEKWDN